MRRSVRGRVTRRRSVARSIEEAGDATRGERGLIRISAEVTGYLRGVGAREERRGMCRRKGRIVLAKVPCVMFVYFDGEDTRLSALRRDRFAL